jgi:hypothetical protein
VTPKPHLDWLNPVTVRLRSEEPMTYIAAFRSPDGIVLSADSQETIGTYKMSVDKIALVDFGNHQLAIGGAGQSMFNGLLLAGADMGVSVNSMTRLCVQILESVAAVGMF